MPERSDMNRDVWERASVEGMALTLAYVVTCLEQSTERISPPVLLALIEEKLKSYEPPCASSVSDARDGATG
jgi:hypothetical protein